MGEGDWSGAREFLRDDLTFVGPFETFHRADDYLNALKKLHHIVERVEPKKMFVDGDDVCLLYDLVTNTPAGTSFVAEWHHIEKGKISQVHTVFDARPFAPMFKP